MNATMALDLTVMSETELEGVDGGMMPLIALAAGVYMGLLGKVEAYPEHYTWTMDWYYN